MRRLPRLPARAVAWRRSRPAQEPPTRPEFAHRVDDEATWDALKHVSGAALPGSETVKVVVDRREATRWTPYFLDTVRYPTHIDFCRRLDPRSEAGFDTVMYRSPDRPFVLLTLTRLVEEDLWWLELWPGDVLDAADVVRVVELLRDAAWFGDRLRFKAASDDQRRRLTVEATPQQVERLGPLLDQGAVYRGLTYQGLTLGTAYGRLRVVRDGPGLDAELAGLTPYDVVVTETIPLEIGPVSGLVTSEHQTPLAHVAVLSENRGSPNCALVDAAAREDVRALEGSWVRLVVDRTTWSLEPADEAVARADVDRRLGVMRGSAPQLVLDLRRRVSPG